MHAGDLTKSGSFDEVQASLTWFASQPRLFKVLIAGNHDACCGGCDARLGEWRGGEEGHCSSEMRRIG